MRRKHLRLKYPKIPKSAHNYPKRIQKLQKYPKVPNCTQKYPIVPKSTQLHPKVLKVTKISLKYPKVQTNTQNYPHIPPNYPKVSKSIQNVKCAEIKNKIKWIITEHFQKNLLFQVEDINISDIFYKSQNIN